MHQFLAVVFKEKSKASVKVVKRPSNEITKAVSMGQVDRDVDVFGAEVAVEVFAAVRLELDHLEEDGQAQQFGHVVLVENDVAGVAICE